MKKKILNEQSEAANSGPNDSEKSAEYVRFENAAKILFRYDPGQAKKARKVKVPRKKPKDS
jgi:hypothetical protein